VNYEIFLPDRLFDDIEEMGLPDYVQARIYQAMLEGLEAIEIPADRSRVWTSELHFVDPDTNQDYSFYLRAAGRRVGEQVVVTLADVDQLPS